MPRTTKFDRWVWRHIGHDGAVVINCSMLLGFVLGIAALVWSQV